MQLHREAPDPLYIQLKDSLVADIKAGHYGTHQRLPSERELADHFQVSRMTARQALVQLAHDGVVYTRKGMGTFVAGPKIDQQLRALTGFTQDVQTRGERPSSRVLEACIIASTPEVAAMLRLAPGADAIKLARLRLADGFPLAIETAYLPSAPYPNLLRHDFSEASLYRVLEEEYGVTLMKAEQAIEAALAQQRELELLELTPPAAVMRIQRLTFTGQGVPVEFVQSTYRGDRYKFRSALQAGRAP